MTSPEFLGTRLRHLLERLEGAVAEVYDDLGLSWFRPRFTAYIRELSANPRSIKELAEAVGVTHSAASQTVAQLVKDELATLEPGRDARQRIVRLTPAAERLLPVLHAEWAATARAAREVEGELSAPLSAVVEEMIAALDRRSMRERIGAADPELISRWGPSARDASGRTR
ncbi:MULTISPECIES: MarR family winged helix-turn-helix transcriptional regulator [Actinokineospora]|uniref:MarR family transcriptional regulator n=1 Tax=Actinokineospora fastidiosa TaxID=1816 RepID=A0A918LFZ0_9PSEU|nr:MULTISPECIES: MarR family transcriptional regulator [Actinokineospora]GGS41608.1 MarR family transcriptional regulator [Actinokineospora fastidiosa]